MNNILEEIIETKRLLCRPLTHNDAEGMYELDSNTNVHIYLGNNPVKSIEEIHQVLDRINSDYQMYNIGRFAMVLKSTNHFIGWAGIKWNTRKENGFEGFHDIGYRIIEEFWGQGYGSEAAMAWIDYAFNIMKLDIIHASAHVENIPSQLILKKIGMLERNQYFVDNNIPWIWFELKRIDFEK